MELTREPKGMRNGWYSLANERHITDLLYLGDTPIGRVDLNEGGEGFVGGYLGQRGYTQVDAPSILLARAEVQKYATGCIGAHCPDLATLMQSVVSGAFVYAGSEYSTIEGLNGLFELREHRLDHFVRDVETGDIVVIEPYDLASA